MNYLDRQILETGSRIEVTGAAGRRGGGRLVLHRHRASVWDGEKALDMDSGDGHTTL